MTSEMFRVRYKNVDLTVNENYDSAFNDSFNIVKCWVNNKIKASITIDLRIYPHVNHDTFFGNSTDIRINMPTKVCDQFVVKKWWTFTIQKDNKVVDFIIYWFEDEYIEGDHFGFELKETDNLQDRIIYSSLTQALNYLSCIYIK
jgi:hypothetical protein